MIKLRWPWLVSILMHVVLIPALSLSQSTASVTKTTPAIKVMLQERLTTKPAPQAPTVTKQQVQKDVAAVTEQSAAHSQFNDAKVISNQPPSYPYQARRRGYEGTVLLKVEVLGNGESGRVQIIRSSGYSMLDRAAKKALKLWRFQPAKRLNKPVSSWVQIPIRFALNDRA